MPALTRKFAGEMKPNKDAVVLLVIFSIPLAVYLVVLVVHLVGGAK